MRNCEIGDDGHVPKSNYVRTEIHQLNSTPADGQPNRYTAALAKQRNTPTTSWVAKAIFTHRLIRIWRNANEFWKIFKLKFNYNRFGYWGTADNVSARPGVLGMMKMCLTAAHPKYSSQSFACWSILMATNRLSDAMNTDGWEETRIRKSLQWLNGAGNIHSRRNGQQTKWTVIDIINRNIIYFQMNKLLTDLGVTVIAVFYYHHFFNDSSRHQRHSLHLHRRNHAPQRNHREKTQLWS